MYADPKLIRNKRVVIYVNSYEYEDLEEKVASTGGERGVIARERYLMGAEADLHSSQSAHAAPNKPALHPVFA
jgi:hypothetical protein